MLRRQGKGSEWSSTCAQASMVAPVVSTSSTIRKCGMPLCGAFVFCIVLIVCAVEAAFVE